MRIAIDCSHRRVPGGIRSYLDNLLPALARAAPEHEYLHYFRGLAAPAAPPPLPDGTHARTVHVRIPGRWLNSFEQRFGWPRLEQWTGDVDLVHGTHFVLPCARPTTTQVLTVHDVTYLRHPEYYRDTALNEHGYRTLLPASLRRADAVIALSHAARDDIAELCDVDPARIWVVPHGLDPHFKQASETAQALVRARLDLPGPFVIYPVGSIDVRKNLPRTLQAYAQAFPRRGERPTLLLTGVGGIQLSELFAVSERLGIADSVRMTEVGYPDELVALYSAANWGLYPSLYEGFGLPPLEAMACGLPMLVSNRTSCPEVVGDAALLVDPTEVDALAAGMTRLQEDETLRRVLSERGLVRATAASFHWLRAARQTLAVYRRDREAYDAEPQPLAPAPTRAAMQTPATVQ